MPEDRSRANRERLDRLKNPDRYTDSEPAETTTPKTESLDTTKYRRSRYRRKPLINSRRIDLQRLKPPPRSIALTLRLRVFLGGWMQQFGWAFFGFGMIFFWIFGMQADVAWPLLSGTTQTTTAVVTSYHKTTASEGGSDTSPGTPVYSTQYDFQVDGQKYTGESFATGRYRQQGQTVEVEYSINDPVRSRIVGMRNTRFGPAAIFVVLFPIIGAIFISIGIRTGLKSLYQIKNGNLAYGTLTKKFATGTRINEQTVYALQFTFKDRVGREAIAEARSHQPQCLEDEAEEPLLYSENRKGKVDAVMLDGIPGRPTAGQTGQLVCESPAEVVTVLILPLLTLIGHGSYLYFAVL